MAATRIDHLILNSPYTEPALHWHYDRETRTFSTAEGRRSAGYVKATSESRAFDDPGVFVELPLVNQIRPRVKAWRAAGYPGAGGITRRLLEPWQDPQEREHRRFFFCQLEDGQEPAAGAGAGSRGELLRRWPNILRIDHVYRPRLELDLARVKDLTLNASETATLAELA